MLNLKPIPFFKKKKMEFEESNILPQPQVSSLKKKTTLNSLLNQKESFPFVSRNLKSSKGQCDSWFLNFSTQKFINCPFKVITSKNKMDLGLIYFFKINSVKMKKKKSSLWSLNIKVDTS